ncbi:hypothetical protein [Enterococcus olivae]
MKKAVWMSLFMGILVLVGCGKSANQAAASTESSKESTEETIQSQSSISSTTSESTFSTESVEESSLPETSETMTSQSAEEISAFEQLIDRYPNVELPKEIPHTAGNVLNIASTGTEDKLSVLYFDMETPMILNQNALNNERPIAQYQKETYSTKEEAEAAVSLRVDTQGQRVDLGHGITGYQQGAAGSSYLSWKEGNWNLLVRANNMAEQDPVAAAKEIVEYLEKEMLPAPETIGQITVDMNGSDYTSNEVSWQRTNQTYTIRHQEPIAALTMAVSTEK